MVSIRKVCVYVSSRGQYLLVMDHEQGRLHYIYTILGLFKSNHQSLHTRYTHTAGNIILECT